MLELVGEPDPLAELSTLFAPLGAWAEQAVCAAPGVDPTLFDAPVKGGPGTTAERTARQHQAIALCRVCPVRQECHDDAVANQLTGIRGGVLVIGEPLRLRHHDLIALADAGLLNNAVGYGGPAPVLPAA